MAATCETPHALVLRLYQEISNAMLGFNRAVKVAETPFPFPSRQRASNPQSPCPAAAAGRGTEPSRLGDPQHLSSFGVSTFPHLAGTRR